MLNKTKTTMAVNLDLFQVLSAWNQAKSLIFLISLSSWLIFEAADDLKFEKRIWNFSIFTELICNWISCFFSFLTISPNSLDPYRKFRFHVETEFVVYVCIHPHVILYSWLSAIWFRHRTLVLILTFTIFFATDSYYLFATSLSIGAEMVS